MRPRKSDIPDGVTEVEIQEYVETGQLVHFREIECFLNGKVVGRRSYDSDGRLMIETPLKDGKKHGREYIWDFFSGNLESVEPYDDGKLHGLAKQYGRKGNVIGTYRFVHGTGFDIWRLETEDGSIYISEVFTVKNGSLDGFEWWLNEDQRSVWHERHWQQGSVHGIERMWNPQHRLKRGYPKYWIQGKAVRKRTYLKVAEKDRSLPKFREKENLNRRKFPADIDKLLAR
jgi:antitoxin component YwqK of YwqJK toxin-antitoxin module